MREHGEVRLYPIDQGTRCAYLFGHLCLIDELDALRPHVLDVAIIRRAYRLARWWWRSARDELALFAVD